MGNGSGSPAAADSRASNSLREPEAAEGISAETARSRLDRARLAGLDAGTDMARDRRHEGRRGCGNAGANLWPPLLPHPLDAGAPDVDLRTFANLAVVAKSMLNHRLNQLLRRGIDPAALSRSEIVAALTQRQEREVTITLKLPSGRRLTGGVRAVIRQLLADPTLLAGRCNQIGVPAIRARLRQLPGWPGELTAAGIRWPLGSRRPRPPVSGSPPSPRHPVPRAAVARGQFPKAIP